MRNDTSYQSLIAGAALAAALFLMPPNLLPGYLLVAAGAAGIGMIVHGLVKLWLHVTLAKMYREN